MPITKSARKRMRVTEKKTGQNQKIRSRYKSAIKKLENGLESKEGDLQKLYRNAVKQIDRAASRKIIHKNKASRLKSRLAKRVNNAN